jgi:predicted NAD-dependent protein-ADP-ribosyltransferase YbiA (DUF1768 family)
MKSPLNQSMYRMEYPAGGARLRNLVAITAEQSITSPPYAAQRHHPYVPRPTPTEFISAFSISQIPDAARPPPPDTPIPVVSRVNKQKITNQHGPTPAAPEKIPAKRKLNLKTPTTRLPSYAKDMKRRRIAARQGYGCVVLKEDPRAGSFPEFSLLQPCSLSVYHRNFPSMEHALRYRISQLLGLPEASLLEICSAATPSTARISGILQTGQVLCNQNKQKIHTEAFLFNILFDIYRQQMSNNPALIKKLELTKGAYLLYQSSDTTLGCPPDTLITLPIKDTPKPASPLQKFVGSNLVGRALMILREEICKTRGYPHD